MTLPLNILFALLFEYCLLVTPFQFPSEKSLSQVELPSPTILITTLHAMIPPNNITKSRLVFKTHYKADADQIVYVTPHKFETNLVVYETNIRAEIKQQKGFWYWTSFQQEADWKIYFTNHRNEANLVVYYTKFKQEANAQ